MFSLLVAEPAPIFTTWKRNSSQIESIGGTAWREPHCLDGTVAWGRCSADECPRDLSDSRRGLPAARAGYARSLYALGAGEHGPGLGAARRAGHERIRRPRPPARPAPGELGRRILRQIRFRSPVRRR